MTKRKTVEITPQMIEAGKDILIDERWELIDAVDGAAERVVRRILSLACSSHRSTAGRQSPRSDP